MTRGHNFHIQGEFFEHNAIFLGTKHAYYNHKFTLRGGYMNIVKYHCLIFYISNLQLCLCEHFYHWVSRSEYCDLQNPSHTHGQVKYDMLPSHPWLSTISKEKGRNENTDKKQLTFVPGSTLSLIIDSSVSLSRLFPGQITKKTSFLWKI